VPAILARPVAATRCAERLATGLEIAADAGLFEILAGINKDFEVAPTAEGQQLPV
jgi:hypothetical protein